MRRANMGKFEGGPFVNEYIYSIMLDSGPEEPNEELGDAQDFGWYGFMEGGPDILERAQEIAKEQGEEPITDEEEIDYLSSPAFILHEGSQGFFDVDAYESLDEAKENWARIEADYQDFMAEAEDDQGPW